MTAVKQEQVKQYILDWCERTGWTRLARIPSINTLTKSCQVGRNTVINALLDLQHEGVIESHPRSGFFIRKKSSRKKTIVPMLNQFEFERIDHGLAVISIAHEKHGVLELGGGTPAPSLLATAMYRQELRSWHSIEVEDLAHYQDSQGFGGLREAIAAQDTLTGLLDVEPDGIQLTNGGSEAIYLALQVLLQSGSPKTFALESPGYYLLYPTLQFLGGEMLPIKRGMHTLDLEMLQTTLKKQRIAAVMVNTNHQNPLGGMLDLATRKELVRLAEQHEFWIIEDDVYRGLWVHKPELPAIVSLCPERTFYVGSFSKTLGPGVRVGFMIAPKAWRKQIHHLKFLVNLCGDQLMQKRLAHFVDSHRYATHLQEMRQELLRRYKIAAAQLHPFKHIGQLQGEYQGGLFLKFQFEQKIAMAKLYEAAKKEKLLISPDELFCAEHKRKSDESWMRLNVSNAQDTYIQRAMTILSKLPLLIE